MVDRGRWLSVRARGIGEIKNQIREKRPATLARDFFCKCSRVPLVSELRRNDGICRTRGTIGVSGPSIHHALFGIFFEGKSFFKSDYCPCSCPCWRRGVLSFWVILKSRLRGNPRPFGDYRHCNLLCGFYGPRKTAGEKVRSLARGNLGWANRDSDATPPYFPEFLYSGSSPFLSGVDSYSFTSPSSARLADI